MALYRQPPLDALMAPAIGEPGVSTLSTSDLLDHQTLGQLLSRFACTYGKDADRKAVASIWSKYYFSSISIPTLAANLLLEYDLPVAPDQLRLEFSEKGQAERVWLAHGGEPLRSHASMERFQALFDGHCMPLIEVLASLSGLSPKVFWSNLGHYVEYVGRTCCHSSSCAGAGNPLLDFLDTRRLPDGRRNPLYQPVRYLDLGGETPARVRRLCCVRYRNPDEPLCDGCPLKPENRPVKYQSGHSQSPRS